jgi:hypothetical protein
MTLRTTLAMFARRRTWFIITMVALLTSLSAASRLSPVSATLPTNEESTHLAQTDHFPSLISTFQSLPFAPNPQSLISTHPSTASSHTIAYTYDAAGRLIQAYYGSKIVIYTYDDAGNLLRQSSVNLPAQVVVGGPASGHVNIAYVFTATVSPITTTLPITFTWQDAGGVKQEAASGSLSNTAILSWTTPGTQVITVTAANAGGVVVDGAHSIVISEFYLYLPVITKGQ